MSTVRQWLYFMLETEPNVYKKLNNISIQIRQNEILTVHFKLLPNYLKTTHLETADLSLIESPGLLWLKNLHTR